MSSSTTSGTTDLAATYAALILADADVEITAPKILAITTAANVEIEPIWATLLAKALEGKNVKEMAVGVAGAPATGAAGQVTGKLEVQELLEAPAEDHAPDSDEDSDDNLFGGGLFD